MTRCNAMKNVSGIFTFLFFQRPIHASSNLVLCDSININPLVFLQKFTINVVQRHMRSGCGNSDNMLCGKAEALVGHHDRQRNQKNDETQLRRHSPAFKAKVALAALKDDKTLAELV